MIFDNIKNYKMYCDINPKFEKAFGFIQKAIEENLKPGKYEIDGKEIYALVQDFDTKLKDDCVFEGHKNHIDIQYIVSGCEVMGILEISNAVIKEAYDAEKDAAFYKNGDIPSYIVAKQGDFCVFYPQDIHSPCIAYDNVSSNVKKIVIKVHI